MGLKINILPHISFQLGTYVYIRRRKRVHYYFKVSRAKMSASINDTPYMVSESLWPFQFLGIQHTAIEYGSRFSPGQLDRIHVRQCRIVHGYNNPLPARVQLRKGPSRNAFHEMNEIPPSTSFEDVLSWHINIEL